MRSDARKRELLEGRCSCGNKFVGDNLCMPSACQWEGIARDESPVDDILAPFVALAEAADRQFGSAQAITRDALWAAIAVARGEQS